MKAKYVKPEMEISTVEMEDLMNIMVVSGMEVGGENNGPYDTRRREELWIEDVDLWGNESWTRVDL